MGADYGERTRSGSRCSHIRRGSAVAARVTGFDNPPPLSARGFNVRAEPLEEIA